MQRVKTVLGVKDNLLVAIVESQGGMLDVSKSYLEYFRTQARPEFLLIFTEDKKRLREKAPEGVYFLYARDLYKLESRPSRQVLKQVKEIVDRHQIAAVLCDYIGFLFFEDLNVLIFADVHYLIAQSNRVRRKFAGKRLQSYLMRDTDWDFGDLEFIRWLWKKERLEREFIRRSAEVFVNSLSTKKDVLTCYRRLLGGRPVLTIPIAPCLGPSLKMESRKSSKSQIKAKILFHGRLNWIKGVHYLPDIARACDTPLVMVGADRRFRKLMRKDLPRNLKIVDWCAPQKLEREFLQRYRFHIFPSLYEPWGLALTKSLLSGAICIANKSAGGHREQIRNGVNGFLLNFDSPHLASQIQAILNLPAKEYIQISEYARKSAVEGIERSQSYPGLAFGRMRRGLERSKVRKA